MAHLLPCDADGVCMRCKVHPPDSDVILCDSCSSPWHMACLDPPLDAVPAGNWSCPDCSDLAPGPAPSLQPGTSSSPADVAADGDAGPASLAAKVRALQEDTSLDERERARLRQKLVIEHGRETALANGRGAKGKARGQASPGVGRSGSKRKASEVEEGAEKSEERGRKEDARGEEEEEEEESELKQAMKCGVCLETVDRPITTPCGHNCCLKCFTKWVGQGNKKCPKCRALIPPRMIANPRINSALVAAIRFANAAKANKGPAGPSTPGHYKPLANEQRPDAAFTTERAKKTGKANACSGRIFVTIPPDHFGPITAEYDEVRHRGVLVGDNWADRLECRQWGAHFPHVAGIAGQSDYGAQSVALSGGYEDDEDNGEWFLYTGSGGRDLSGNKRTNKHHSFHQTFTAANEALRVSCTKGYPVRVVRSHKEKRSSYAPEEGVRYDGVYRIERCWRKKGAGGFLVCRYLFVRCDNEAAPWTSEEQGDRPRPLPEIEELKEAQNLSERKGKAAWDWNEDTEKWEWVSPPPTSRKMGTPRSASGKKRTSKTAHKRLLKDFGCSLCKKVLTNPVSTPCAHNFCKACLEKKFAGTAVCRERGPSGRALRVQKVVKDCPAPQCTNDLAEFLTTMKVNLEMVDIIDLLRKKAEEEKKAAEEGKEEGEEGEDGGEGEEAEGGGEEEGAGTQEGEEEEDEEGDIREVKAEAGLAPEVHEAKDLSNGVQGAQESHGVEEEVNGVKEEVNGVKEEVNGVKEEVNGVKEEVDGVKEGTDGVVEAKVSEVKGRGRKRKSEGAPSGSGTGTGTGAGTTLKRCSNPKGTPPKATPPLRGRAAALANGSPPA